MTMRPLQPRELVLVIIAAVVCAAALIYMYLIRPQLDEVSSLQSRISQLSRQVELHKAESAAKPSQTRSAKHTNSPTPSPASQIVAHLPHRSDEPGALTAVYQMAQHTHVTIAKVAATESPTGGKSNSVSPTGLPSLQLQMDVQGTATQIQAFLTYIDKSERLMQVKDLSLTPLPNGHTDAQFALYAFFINH